VKNFGWSKVLQLREH